jgi:hypothetical protein
MSILRRARHERAPARHVEIWGQLEESNRFLRRLAIAAVVWAFVALSAAGYAGYIAVYRPLAYHVDATGEATYVGRLREQSSPTDAEVRFVAKEFLRRHLAFNSITIEADFAEAWNLMTDELREEHEHMLADYQRQNDRDFVAYVRDQQIQTTLDFDRARFEVTGHNGNAFTVRAVGTARTWPLSRIGDEAAYSEKHFESFVTLVRCPRTELTPNGLLVAKVASKFHVDEPSTHEPAGTAPPVEDP